MRRFTFVLLIPLMAIMAAGRAVAIDLPKIPDQDPNKAAGNAAGGIIQDLISPSGYCVRHFYNNSFFTWEVQNVDGQESMCSRYSPRQCLSGPSQTLILDLYNGYSHIRITGYVERDGNR